MKPLIVAEAYAVWAEKHPEAAASLAADSSLAISLVESLVQLSRLLNKSICGDRRPCSLDCWIGFCFKSASGTALPSKTLAIGSLPSSKAIETRFPKGSRHSNRVNDSQMHRGTAPSAKFRHHTQDQELLTKRSFDSTCTFRTHPIRIL